MPPVDLPGASLIAQKIPWTERQGGLLQPTRLLCPWDSPGKNPGVDSIPFSRGSPQLRDGTQVSRIGR